MRGSSATGLRSLLAMLLASAFAAACAPADAPEPATREDTVVRLVFTEGERPRPVERPVALAERPPLAAALDSLLAGPRPEERAAGLTSFFSVATRGLLRSATLDEGSAIVDFADLTAVIPGASSSAGSTVLLHQLNGTVFQFPEVHRVEYRMQGSCDLFWNWLQRDCRVVARE